MDDQPGSGEETDGTFTPKIVDFSKVQIELSKAGFDPGSPDGAPGEKTLASMLAALDRLRELENARRAFEA